MAPEPLIMPHTHDHPRPSVTVDVVLFAEQAEEWCVLLIQRRHEPFAGMWAVPGGFVDEGEDVPAAAQRELAEETGVVGLALAPGRAYGKPGRDPRGWTISISHYAVLDALPHTVQAGDDAARAKWFPLDRLPCLAFDHGQIIADCQALAWGEDEDEDEVDAQEPDFERLAEKLEGLCETVAVLAPHLGRVTELEQATAKILATLEDRSRFDRAREVAIEKMHGDLTAYRQQGVEQSKKESLENLVVLYDSFEETLAQIGPQGEAYRAVAWLREMLIETLYREDVEPVPEPAERLDRGLHTVVRTVPTPDPGLDLTIERVLKRGFTWHGQTLRREHVVVRRYEPPSDPEGETRIPPAGIL